MMFESERRDLAWVPRWAIIRVNRRQSVAEHSYFTTCYGVGIAKAIGWPDPPDDSAMLQLAVYLLRHDEGEALESDIPGPIKRLAGFDGGKLAGLLEARFGPPAPKSGDMVKIRKAADLLDECLYLAGEMNSGNAFVKSALEFSTAALEESLRHLPCSVQSRSGLWPKFKDMICREIEAEKDVGGVPHNHDFT